MKALRQLQLGSITIDSRNVTGAVMKSVLRSIDDYARENGACWASSTTIARETCLCDKTVRRALTALETLGYIKKEPHRCETGRLFRVCWERITLDPVTGPSITTTPDPGSTPLDPVTGPMDPGSSTPGPGYLQNDIETKVKRKRNEISIRDSLFDEFWESYPKKEGKKKAREAFEKAVKNGADPKAIIEGAKAYAASDRGTGDPQFIKQPSTFLNGQHWEDEPAAWSKGRAVPFEDPCHKPFPKLKVTRADLAIDDFVLDWNRALTRMDYLSDETRTIAREVFKDEWWLENRKAIVVSFEDRERLIRIGKLKDSPYPHHIELDWIFDNAALVKSLIGSPVPNEMDLAKFGGNE